jgi:carbon monoxide dehydrogenase subunit G
MTDCKITVEDQVYTGEAIEPAVTVKYGSVKLKKGADYTVAYEDNVKPGKATVTVTGKGDYTGAAKVSFDIRVPMSMCKLTVKDQTYTGKALKPAVTVKYGSVTLKKDTDYTVAYKNNVKPGKATVTVTGKGDYTGVAKATFFIRGPMSGCSLTMKNQKMVYTGEPLEPAVTVKCGAIILKKNTDYTVSYSGNKAAGIAELIVTGKGNYTGNKRLTFKILPRTVTISSLSAGKQNLTVRWSKRLEATGYELQYGLKNNFTAARTVKIAKNGTTSAAIKKLEAGKTYYVRIRSYKNANESTLYSAWSKTRSVMVR